MKEIKREYLPLYSFYDRTGIAKHLTEMAAKGWLLEKLNGWCWSYRRIEPKQLHFTVTFFPSATQFDPYPAEGLETFWDFCAEAGWVLAASNAQVQVFYSEQERPVPMETDSKAAFENIHRTMKKGTLRSYWTLLVLGILEALLFLWQVWQNPIDQLSSMIQLNALFAFVPLILLALIELARYYRWRKRAAAALELGDTLPELGSARWLSILILALTGIELLVLAIVCLRDSRGMALTIIMALLYMGLMFFLANGVRKAMQHLHCKPMMNRLVTSGVIIAMTIGMMAGMIALVFKTNGLFTDSNVVETYEYHGMTWDVYADPLPLTIQDLVPTDYTQWSTRLTRDSSPLLTHLEATQRPRMDALEQPDLSYEIVIVKAGFLYGLCKQEYIDWVERDNDKLPPEYWSEYRPIDSAPWGASKVYQQYASGEPRNQFLLCWPDRIAEIHFDLEWEITEALMETVGEKLINA